MLVYEKKHFFFWWKISSASFQLFPNMLSYFCAADVKTCLLCPLFPSFFLLHKQIRVRYNLLIKILQVSSLHSKRTEFLSLLLSIFFFSTSAGLPREILNYLCLAWHITHLPDLICREEEFFFLIYLFLSPLPTRHGELTTRLQYITATQPSNKARERRRSGKASAGRGYLNRA